MKCDELIKILNTASQLKQNTRHSWLANGRRESVAEHSWRLSLFAYFVKDEFPDVDIDKIIKMCIFHDMGEAFTGDIPSFLKSESDEEKENHILDEWVNSLPSPYKTELAELYKEINEQQTQEAKLFKALDKLEAAISHNEADLSTWIELEYELNPVYGKEESQFSQYTKDLQSQVYNDSIEKIKASEKTDTLT